MISRQVYFRKLIFYSSGSVAVTVPISWVRDSQLRYGDVVRVSADEGGNLIIGRKPVE